MDGYPWTDDLPIFRSFKEEGGLQDPPFPDLHPLLQKRKEIGVDPDLINLKKPFFRTGVLIPDS